jgi:hypothetical protein
MIEGSSKTLNNLTSLIHLESLKQAAAPPRLAEGCTLDHHSIVDDIIIDGVFTDGTFRGRHE